MEEQYYDDATTQDEQDTMLGVILDENGDRVDHIDRTWRELRVHMNPNEQVRSIGGTWDGSTWVGGTYYQILPGYNPRHFNHPDGEPYLWVDAGAETESYHTAVSVNYQVLTQDELEALNWNVEPII